ncbi:unnamed protein product [Caenorhabditis nigoni]
MPFPVLRTSFVVLSEIIRLLEPNEIVTASFCSKKVRRLLKRHFEQRKPLEWRFLMLDYYSGGLVDIVTSKGSEQITVIAAKDISVLKGHTLKNTDGYKIGFSSSKYPVFYFNDRVKGSKTIVDYVTRLFGLDIYGLLADRNGIWAIDWINNRQKKRLEYFALNKTVKYNLNDDETLDYVLRNTRTSLCVIDENVSDSFKFNGEMGPMKQLYIHSKGHWVTLNNLINFNVLFISIKGSRLSVSDLNSFLRHWRSGGSARLEWLHLNFEEHIFRERFDEDLEVVETDEERVYRRSFDGWEKLFHGGYSIQRMDGAKAMIQCNLGRFIMAVWHER